MNIINQLYQIFNDIKYSNGKKILKNLYKKDCDNDNATITNLQNDIQSINNNNDIDDDIKDELIDNRINAINSIINHITERTTFITFEYTDKRTEPIIQALQEVIDEEDMKQDTSYVMENIIKCIKHRRDDINNINNNRQNPIRKSLVEVRYNYDTYELYARFSWIIIRTNKKHISSNYTTINNTQIHTHFVTEYNLINIEEPDFQSYETKAKNKINKLIKRKSKKVTVNKKELSRIIYEDIYAFKERYCRIYECDNNGVRIRYNNNNVKLITDNEGYYMYYNEETNSYQYVMNASNNKTKYCKGAKLCNLYITNSFKPDMAIKIINYGSPYSLAKVIGTLDTNGFIQPIYDNSLCDKLWAIPSYVDTNEKYCFSKKMFKVPPAIIYESVIENNIINDNPNDVPDVPEEYDSDVSDDDLDDIDDEINRLQAVMMREENNYNRNIREAQRELRRVNRILYPEDTYSDDSDDEDNTYSSTSLN